MAGSRQVEPWTARKSKRGRKKVLDTEGVACPNPKCDYVGIGDSTLHAIVGDGKRGMADDIPYWRCQCCQRRFSSRLGTPLYHLKTPPQRVTEAMTAFAEGVDVSAAHRIFGHDERTLSDWLKKGGRHAQRIQDRLFHDLHCGHLQLDELVTRVRSSINRVRVWVSADTIRVDAQTKLIPVVHIGRRKRDDAMAFVHRLKDRLAQGSVSFDDIERLLGEPLPQSALTHRSWWENDRTENAQAIAWLRAGCLVSDVDFATRQVTFRYTEHALMQLFFYDVLERLKQARPGITRATKAYAQAWWQFSGGRSGFSFVWSFPKGSTVRVELYIDLGDAAANKAAFDKLALEKDRIEHEIGSALNWERLDHRRASRISIAHPVEITGPADQLEKAKARAVEYMLKFVDAFQPKIKLL